jgi:hypothetical protein
MNKNLNQAKQVSEVNNNIVYDFNKLKNVYSFFEILKEEDFYVFYNSDDNWLEASFFKFSYSNDMGKEVKLSLICTVSGTTGLRECRHTYFGEDHNAPDGYIFYLNKSNFIIMLEWLSKYFDMD